MALVGVTTAPVEIPFGHAPPVALEIFVCALDTPVGRAKQGAQYCGGALLFPGCMPKENAPMASVHEMVAVTALPVNVSVSCHVVDPLTLHPEPFTLRVVPLPCVAIVPEQNWQGLV
jgi:hypothetical protein